MILMLRKLSVAAAFGAFGLVGAVAAETAPTRLAQATPAKPAPRAQAPKPAEATAQPAGQPAAGQPAPAPAPVRTEIVAYDGWSVTCREFAEPKPHRSCTAAIQVNQQNSGQLVFGWAIQVAEDGRTEAVIRTPTGVSLGAGIELKLGAAAARKLAYTTCEPTFCTASFVMDAAFVKDAGATETAEVTLTASVGNRLQINVPLKGADRALTALRR